MRESSAVAAGGPAESEPSTSSLEVTPAGGVVGSAQFQPAKGLPAASVNVKHQGAGLDLAVRSQEFRDDGEAEEGRSRLGTVVPVPPPIGDSWALARVLAANYVPSEGPLQCDAPGVFAVADSFPLVEDGNTSDANGTRLQYRLPRWCYSRGHVPSSNSTSTNKDSTRSWIRSQNVTTPDGIVPLPLYVDPWPPLSRRGRLVLRQLWPGRDTGAAREASDSEVHTEDEADADDVTSRERAPVF